MAPDDCNNVPVSSGIEEQKVAESDEMQIPIEELQKRVPEILRKGNEDANPHNPRLISIGPLSQVILAKDMAPDDRNNVSLSGPEKQKVSVYDEIQIPMEQLQEKVSTFINSKCCIYKVPEILRKENEDAYTPHFISIGPIHYDNPKLKPMEEHKIRYLYYFRKRVTVEVLKGFAKYLESSEEEIRNCYSEKYPLLNKDEFVRMITLDAIFIMELFLKYAGAKDDYIFNKPWLFFKIRRDLLLAENQIPFFVLEKLYKHLKNQVDKNFLELACKFFGLFIQQKDLWRVGWDDPKHFTDFYRSSRIPRVLEIEKLSEDLYVKNATKLRSAGISFKPAAEDKCLLDVDFKKEEFLNWFPFLGCLPYLSSVKSCLLFPELRVNDSTEYVLRNLMAFEQCHYPGNDFICSYANLIDMLIEEEEDVAVLIEGGVIINDLGSEKELKTLINKLCKNIVITSHCFGKVLKDLNDHYKNPWNKAVAELRLVYFSNLWKGTGTVVAIIVLFISIFNFIRSNIEYF